MITLPNIQGYVFDLDGTLIHSLPGIAYSLNLALTDLGMKTYTENEIRTFIGNGVENLIQRARGENPTALDTLLAQFRIHYAIHWNHNTLPYPGITQWLEKIRTQQKPLAVLSNKPHPFTVKIVAEIFGAETFSIVLGERENIPRKPAPDALLEIAKHWNIPIQNIAMIGDSDVDLLSAKNAGAYSVAVTWGYQDPEKLRTYSPDQIISLPQQKLP